VGSEETRWIAVLFGAALILIAIVSWYASRRWPLAGVIFQLAAAAMATRLAVVGPEMDLPQLGMSEALAFRLVAGAAALFCLYGAVMQIVAWLRYRSGGDNGGG
jgi:4-hydroxybenzoate polyprenyltransferase